MAISGKKINQFGYVDFSDFARPLGIGLAKFLVLSPVRAYHITIIHFMFGLGACILFYERQFGLGIILLQIKNWLDATDGSLARLQNRPSKVGRFLDSNLDFIVNLGLFASITGMSWWERGLSAFSFVLQCSVYNYYTIIFRTALGGESTSKLQEDGTSHYSYDNPRAVKILFIGYKYFYLWQDKLIDWIELKLLKTHRKIPSVLFANWISVHGLGFQYLVFSALLVINPQYLSVYFCLIANWLLIGQLVYRKYK